jgi:hypothetical protein
MQGISKKDDKGLVNFLISRIPEFKDKSSQIEDGSAYLHYGAFGLFLLDIIDEKMNKELIDRSFNLLNDLINLDDPDINTMLRVEVIELLADNNKAIALCKEKLEGLSLVLFNKVYKFLETGQMPAFW